MSLRIISVVRHNPAPCKHYTITIDDNGETKTCKTSEYEISSGVFNSRELDSAIVAVLNWMHRRLNTGSTMGQLEGKFVE